MDEVMAYEAITSSIYFLMEKIFAPPHKVRSSASLIGWELCYDSRRAEQQHIYGQGVYTNSDHMHYASAQEEGMGIFSRLMNFLRIRTSSMLDKAEEPGQVMDYSYNKQLEQLQQLRRSIADVVTNEKRLELQQSQLLEKANTLDTQARQALQANREDLARMALQRKETLVTQLNGYEQQIALLHAQQEKLIGMERTVSARVEAFRTQKEMVKAQYNAAQAQVKINETLTGISEEMSEMNLAMQRAQDKVLSMQARANAMETLIEQGTLSEQGMLGRGGDTLDRELQQISSQQNVDAQLQAMKQQLQLGGSNAHQKQIEGPA